MNFREEIIERILQLLRNLVVEESQVRSIAQGELLITPNTTYAGVLRSVDLGPLETTPVDNKMNDIAPAAFVSFDGGRHDLGLDTFVTHLVETLGIRVEVILNRKIGAAVGERPRALTLQASDLLADLDRLVTTDNLRSALNHLDDVTVQEVVIEEWEFDERFRGGQVEVLSIVFQAQIANPRQQP